jgi:hypothetical protein
MSQLTSSLSSGAKNLKFDWLLTNMRTLSASHLVQHVKPPSWSFQKLDSYTYAPIAVSVYALILLFTSSWSHWWPQAGLHMQDKLASFMRFSNDDDAAFFFFGPRAHPEMRMHHGHCAYL